jgi:hypothetical protein
VAADAASLATGHADSRICCIAIAAAIVSGDAHNAFDEEMFMMDTLEVPYNPHEEQQQERESDQQQGRDQADTGGAQQQPWHYHFACNRCRTCFRQEAPFGCGVMSVEFVRAGGSVSDTASCQQCGPYGILMSNMRHDSLACVCAWAAAGGAVEGMRRVKQRKRKAGQLLMDDLDNLLIK